MRKIPILLSFILLSALFACKTQFIQAPKPIDVAYVAPVKQNSFIGLPIHISTNGMAASINKKFQVEIYKDDKFDDNANDNLKLTVLKRNNFIVSTSTDGISITAPLHIDFVYNLKAFGAIEKPISQSLNLTVIFNTTPSIDRDWNLKLNSKGKIAWDDLPVINLGITTLNLPDLFGSIIQGQVNKMAIKIDQEASKNMDIKKIVGEAYKNLSEPILLDSTQKAWLLINPKSIFITPITYTNEEMLLKLGINSMIELVSGYKPKNDSFSTSLPPLRQANSFNDQVKINLSANISFDQINEKLAQQFVEKPMLLEGDEYKINIKDAKAYPYGNKIMLALNVDGKISKGKLGKGIKGIVYAVGIPNYNAITKSLEVKQFDFDIKTRDILLKSATWLLNSKKFRESIEKQMIFSIATQLNDAKKSANDAIDKKWLDLLDLSGTISKIELAGIYISPKNLNINITTEGTLKVSLTGF
ncbi:MAG: DUF4403 family protein [Bacteroidetes bacterium]|nr:DUF4403 family protein [Bacteroidota bacterium]